MSKLYFIITIKKMKFKRKCCECGKETQTLINGKCEECHCAQFPPIEEFKPLTLHFCNVTKKIAYNNIYYEQEDLLEKLPQIVTSKIKLNKGYTLNDVEIENIEIDGHIITFDVGVECDFSIDEV